MRLTQEEIKKIIPHRDPFLFIDEMIELESLHRGVGIKYVRPDEAFFKGHFPGKPVMPGVLIIESLAQVGAVILLSHPDYAGKIAYFTGISNAKFRKSVLPGDMLELHCELTKIRRGFGFGQAKAFVNGELACETEISFAVGN
ncbi:MAG: 3-hydroxyacyl-ACP dehydratase FabZ [Acholeplasmataceae bacterium]|jgi:3-hydroxyacyl-[acyl-carrier-protein] dehydratase|nr:3-hydroxyacyl-ACP dehydratase FabZ [Acholeplasmataceae bacterium]